MKVPPDGEIVQTQWRSGNRSVCFVAVQYKDRYWQAYVTAEKPMMFGGVEIPEQPEETEFQCATFGAKLSWEEAHAFFPELDITNYKTYPCREE